MCDKRKKEKKKKLNSKYYYNCYKYLLFNDNIN